MYGLLLCIELMPSCVVQSFPNMVYVFPEPVCPYAKIVALMPLQTDMMDAYKKDTSDKCEYIFLFGILSKHMIVNWFKYAVSMKDTNSLLIIN